MTSSREALKAARLAHTAAGLARTPVQAKRIADGTYLAQGTSGTYRIRKAGSDWWLTRPGVNGQPGTREEPYPSLAESLLHVA